MTLTDAKPYLSGGLPFSIPKALKPVGTMGRKPKIMQGLWGSMLRLPQGKADFQCHLGLRDSAYIYIYIYSVYILLLLL